MAKEVTKTYDMSEIKSGYYICWEVCSQALYASKIKLTDENGTEYFKHEKKNDGTSGFNMLGQNSAVCRGNKLQLVVTAMVDNDTIKQSINSYNITDSNAGTVGHGYNLCIEDSVDEDYNDIYVNLVGWKKNG